MKSSSLNYFLMRTCILSLLFIIQTQINGQLEGIDNNIKLPSPNASAIAKYGNIPVNTYTGSYNISIPIYTYQSPNGKFSLPVSLNYQTGGVKVDEMSPNTGLNWALQAGGVITRSMVGLPDDYFPAGMLYNNGFQPHQDSLREYMDGRMDPESDVFSFNFNGRNGRFYLNNITAQNKIFFPDATNLKIEYTIDIGNKLATFTITDEYGVKYIFSDTETTLLNNGIINISHVSAWYLSRIEFPYNDAPVTFSYETVSLQYVASKSESIGFMYGGRHPNGIVDIPYSYAYQSSDMVNKRIKKIRLPDNGEVTFVYQNDRTDLTGDKSLDSIKITNGLGWKLNYDYSVGSRLTLKSVSQFSAGQTMPPYLLEYNEGLPARFSNSQDAWGYYNGKTNTMLIPKIEPYEEDLFTNGNRPVPSTLLNAADRSVDTNYVNAGTIKKITYPTGGYSSFEYEAHRTAESVKLPYPTYKQQQIVMSGLETTNYTEFDILNDYDADELEFNFIFADYPWGIDQSYAFFYSVKSLDDLQTFATATFYYADNAGAQIDLKNLYSLNKGKYKIVWTTNYPGVIDEPFTFTLKWKDFETDTIRLSNLEVGGSRIKKITDYDSWGNATSRSYKYMSEDGTKSSGVLLYKPVYAYTYQQHDLLQGVPDEEDNYLNAAYYIRFSNSLYSLSYLQGSHISYTRVEEIITSASGNNGRTVYYYNTPTVEAMPMYPFPPITNLSWRGQFLREQKVFDKNNLLKKRLENEYLTITLPQIIEANKVGEVVRSSDNGLRRFNYLPYLLTSEITLTQKNKEVEYISSQDSITQIREYVFDPFNLKHYNPIAIIEPQSKNTQKISVFSYPGDYPTSANPLFIENMKSRNVVNSPVETITYMVDGGQKSIISGYITVYDDSGFGLVKSKLYLKKDSKILSSQFKLSNYLQGELPVDESKKTVYSADTRYEELFIINVYDTYGNIIEQQMKNNIIEVYLWGYYGQYPVAKITGSNWNDIKNIVDTSVLNNGSNAQVLLQLTTLRNYFASNSSVQISSYTYQPFVGMTSETPPNGKTVFYEYDSFNRLHLVKDEEGKILKRICYNYNGQVEECGVEVNTTPLWESTALTRCQPCPANNSYTSNVQEHQEKDNNPNSPTYNTYRWVSDGANSNCIPQADWQNTATAIRCKKNGSNQNTGEQEREQRDMNPCSSTYNQLRWVVTGTNLTACPLPPTCSISNCNGEDKKCVNGVCETGMKVYTQSYFDGSQWVCTYHYEWSDSSWSGNYTEYSMDACIL